MPNYNGGNLFVPNAAHQYFTYIRFPLVMFHLLCYAIGFPDV